MEQVKVGNKCKISGTSLKQSDQTSVHVQTL